MIIQESLTTGIKHSDANTASVELRYGESRLELEILDHGAGLDPGRHDSPRAGHGLLGMRERVALFGGRFEAGSPNGHGYRVLATLPYEP